MKKLEHSDYVVGWICALPLELAAATWTLDEEHSPLPQNPRDDNNYTLGRIGDHNVVIVCLSSGVTGTTSAAVVATRLHSSFPSIRFRLMVGIGGGAPSEDYDVRLGDVVVSRPTGTSGGVFQYDFGKTIQDSRFIQTGSLDKPPSVLLKAVSSLEARHYRGKAELPEHLSQIMSKYPPKLEKAGAYQGAQEDHLFDADYNHPKGNPTCAKCESVRSVPRPDREDKLPSVHYGLIASANQVMRDGVTREKLRKELNVLCFEMEAAGLMDHFPCLVIRGICDYADTHKNKRWQPYAAAVAAAYAKELLCIIPQEQVIQIEKAKQLIFSVPFERDDKFVGRKDIFSKVEEQLSKRHRVSLYGIGGVGKSQIAIEYGYKFQGLHPESHVFWVYAASTTRFVQAYRDIAQEAKLPGYDDPKIDPCNLVFKWLNGDDSGHWLMVVDNADDQDLFFPSDSSSGSSAITEVQSSKPLIEYIPQKLGPSRLLLFTTRNRHLGADLANGELPVKVPTLSPQEARDLLQSKLETEVDLLDMPKLETLLDVLGYNPLAITQAAAFMKRNGQTSQKYFEALENDEHTLIDYLSENLQDHRRDKYFPNAVFRTWKLSFNQLRKQEPPTAKLLSLMVMLDPQRIPEELLRQSAEREVDFTKAIGTLDGLSLITREIGGKTHAIHPLVRLSVHCWLEQNGQKLDYAVQALQLLAKEFPNGEYEHKEKCELLLAHAQAVLCHECTSENDMRQRAALLFHVGYFHWRQGRYGSAYQAALESYDIYQEQAEDVAIPTLDSLGLLASVLQSQGKYEAAEEKNQQALKGYMNVLGVEHPNTLASVSNLALVLRKQGKYKAAEEMNRRALEGYEKVLGVEHPYTLTSVSNLALVLQKQGKYEAAEEMNRRALEGREKVLGVEHPDTLTSVSNLASVLWAQGKYEAAEEMIRRALEGYEKVLGVEHPDTLTSVSNLAGVLQSQGKYKAAEEMNRRALKGREKVLGVEHPETFYSVSNLAVVLQDQGKYEAAEEMNRRALQGKEKVLGVEHPDTLVSVYNLAYMLHHQQRYNEASVLYIRASEGFSKTLGPDHPLTRKCSHYHSSMIHEMQAHPTG